MHTFLSFIVWDIDPEFFTIPGLNHPIRYYSLFFALGFIISQQIMVYFYRQDGRPLKDIDRLTVYMVVATVVGARLGHVLFYEPHIIWEDPIGIIRFWDGGLSGLASHGGTVGILTALYIYSRRSEGQRYFWVLDRIVIVVALTGALIRLGNFMNSEIVGLPTGSDYGVVFARSAENALTRLPGVVETEASAGEGTFEAPVALTLQFVPRAASEAAVRQTLRQDAYALLTDYPYVTQHVYLPADTLPYQLTRQRNTYVAEVTAAGVPRHPAQLYESLWCVVLFVGLFFFWRARRRVMPEGQIFAIFLIALFGFRFLVEFLKENQVPFEDAIPLNMGQWLSLPLVVAGVIILIVVQRRSPRPSPIDPVRRSEKVTR